MLDTYHPEFYIYISRDVRIHGYFLKQKGVHQQKCLGNTDQAGLIHHGEGQGFFEVLTTRHKNTVLQQFVNP
jgi:hypothetical protein